MTSIYDFPQPRKQELLRSNALSNLIKREIKAKNRPISFASFMNFALYHPILGYYNSDTFTLGEHGDFTTAPEISPLFAQCVGKQIQQINLTIDATHILELGAGTGRFANDLLLALDEYNCLPDFYYIFEINLNLRKKQQVFLRKNCPQYFSRIVWLNHLPEHFVGTIIANEVLDALPVNCFKIENNEIKERCVTWKKNTFTWELTSPTSVELAKNVGKLKEFYSLYDGYESEINLSTQEFIRSISNNLLKGVILFIDYGYGQREYYHPERRQGTLSCFYQHMRHHDPFIFPGLQDITTHVDFTNVIEAASDSGCLLSGYTSQAAFLLACGLMSLVTEQEKKISLTEAVNLHYAVKLLTMPTEMGERIKAMALSKNIDLPLIGFNLQDRRRDL